jgi:Papain family cysteine protease
MAIELRDGTQTDDPRLDRLEFQDPRSLDFPISAVVPEEIVKGRTWSTPAWLDQGREGACVGFGVSHELAAYPAAVAGIKDAFAFDIYREAKKIDPWPGEDYEGTSVLAGVKIAQQRGYFDSYRWCFSVEDILRALSHEGPVVVGTNWHRSMYYPAPSGLLKPDGDVVGGHCYLIRGFQLKPRFASEPVLRIRNSWGRDWGADGDAFITLSDYEKHLLPGADQVVFVGRHKTVSQPAPVAQVRTRSLGHWWFSGKRLRAA